MNETALTSSVYTGTQTAVGLGIGLMVLANLPLENDYVGPNSVAFLPPAYSLVESRTSSNVLVSNQLRDLDLIMEFAAHIVNSQKQMDPDMADIVEEQLFDLL